jgi:hypothetical protein
MKNYSIRLDGEQSGFTWRFHHRENIMQQLLTRIRQDAARRGAVVRRTLWSAVLNSTRKAKGVAKSGHTAVDKALGGLEDRANRAIQSQSAPESADYPQVQEPNVRAA